jgi:hypothetical protein
LLFIALGWLYNTNIESWGNTETQHTINEGSHDFQVHQADEQLTESKIAS